MRKDGVEFLAEFELHVPEGTSTSEVEERESAEKSVAGRLADEGHLIRVWKAHRRPPSRRA